MARDKQTTDRPTWINKDTYSPAEVFADPILIEYIELRERFEGLEDLDYEQLVAEAKSKDGVLFQRYVLLGWLINKRQGVETVDPADLKELQGEIKGLRFALDLPASLGTKVKARKQRRERQAQPEEEELEEQT